MSSITRMQGASGLTTSRARYAGTTTIGLLVPSYSSVGPQSQVGQPDATSTILIHETQPWQPRAERRRISEEGAERQAGNDPWTGRDDPGER